MENQEKDLFGIWNEDLYENIFILRLKHEINHPTGHLREGNSKQEKQNVFRLNLEMAAESFDEGKGCLEMKLEMGAGAG